ncbi:MAG TPA: hypothetical protein VEY12_01260 [Thermoplasmata archaeon]|nr:hypothetical protein [Thermoplasmata archaeon]
MEPSLGERLTATSPTFSRDRLRTILEKAKPFHPKGHYLEPADPHGNHLGGYFLLDPVTADRGFVEWIAEDIVAWIVRNRIEFDVLFAPANPALRVLVQTVSRAMGRPAAYWEYLPSGRFGERLVEGRVDRRARALVLNGVSHTGRCVGQRLPEFVEQLGGTRAAAAVFVKGSVPKVAEIERTLGRRFYSALRVDVPVFAAAECPLCRTAGPPVPWTALLRSGKP